MLATYGYDNLGRRSSLTFGNGESASYSYDAVSRLSQLVRNLGGTTNDLTLTFAYNPASQIDSTTRSNDLYAWTGHGSGSTSSTANGLNRLTAHGGTSLAYDARGNMISDGTRSYAYDSENKLTAFPATALHYDPLGRLDGAGAPLALAYENYVDGLIAERTPGSSSVQRRHVFGPGTDEPLVAYEGAGTADRRFLHADERGSIVAVTSSAAGLLSINRYDEYGKPETTGTGGMSRFLYTGQRYFGSPGLYYYKNRFYDPRLPRFMQTDPGGYDDGMNPYAYVGGDPVNFTDPLGLKKRNKPDIPAKHDSGGGGGGSDQTIFVTGNRADQAMRDTLVILNRIATHEFIHRSGMGGNGESQNDDIDGDGQPDPDTLVTGQRPPKVQLAQVEIDMRPPLQRMDDQLGITDAVRAGARYLRNCTGGLPEVNRERAAVAGSKGAIRGSVVGAGRGAVLGSIMGPPGSGWGATGGAVTGTLSGGATGIIGSVVVQACQAGNAG